MSQFALGIGNFADFWTYLIKNERKMAKNGKISD